MKQIVSEFLNEASEVRSLWLGFYSAWYTLRRDTLSREHKKDIKANFHYYSFGYFIGRAIQGILVLLGVKFVM